MNTPNLPNSKKFTVSILLFAFFILLLPTVSAQSEETPEFTGEPIYIGVSGPLTGPTAQYGAQWIKGFDLALEEINGAGGIDGRELVYIFEDSQSDPTQSVVIAQKFVADPRIIVELGDFSSTASMAASPIYQRGGLVQFGFTNSHPDFTKAGGDYTWSISVTQDQASPALADFAVTQLGLKNLAVLQLTNDWGLATYDLFEPRVTELGGNIVALESYLPDEVDFRSALTNIRNANPDGIILISYTQDAALIAQQVQEVGLDIPLIGSGAIQQADLITLGGEAVDGAYVLGQFLPSDPRPLVQTFVENYRAKYEEDPDLFATIAYDTMILISEAIKLGGATREGVHEALAELEDVPSVLYGSITFDLETRRVLNPEFVGLTIQEGEFVPLEATTQEAS